MKLLSFLRFWWFVIVLQLEFEFAIVSRSISTLTVAPGTLKSFNKSSNAAVLLLKKKKQTKLEKCHEIFKEIIYQEKK